MKGYVGQGPSEQSFCPPRVGAWPVACRSVLVSLAWELLEKVGLTEKLSFLVLMEASLPGHD